MGGVRAAMEASRHHPGVMELSVVVPDRAQKRLRVALVSPYDYPYPGGVTEHISYLGRHLRRLGHHVTIVAPSSTPEQELDEHVVRVGSFIVPVPFNGSVARVSLSPRMYIRIRQLLNAEHFDVIHIHEPTVPTLAPAILRYSRSINVGTFHAYRESNTGFEVGKPIFRYMGRLHGRIAVSEATKAYIQQYFPGEFRVIPNGIEVDHFGDPTIKPIEKYTDDDYLNILFVGRLEERKGFRYLLRAFRQVKLDVPSARLLVVGAFEKEDRAPYVKYVRHYHLHDVKFIGYVPSEELPRWYHTADIFCAPSTGYESFGIVLLEAMAAGVPIVASDIAGYRSVLQHGVQGELVPPADPEMLAATLTRLLRDLERRAVYGQAGRETAPRYAWEQVTEQVLSYYRELLERYPEPTTPSKQDQAVEWTRWLRQI